MCLLFRFHAGNCMLLRWFDTLFASPFECALGPIEAHGSCFGWSLKGRNAGAPRGVGLASHCKLPMLRINPTFLEALPALPAPGSNLEGSELGATMCGQFCRAGSPNGRSHGTDAHLVLPQAVFPVPHACQSASCLCCKPKHRKAHPSKPSGSRGLSP